MSLKCLHVPARVLAWAQVCAAPALLPPEDSLPPPAPGAALVATAEAGRDVHAKLLQVREAAACNKLAQRSQQRRAGSETEIDTDCCDNNHGYAMHTDLCR